jgi:hypothetical protein
LQTFRSAVSSRPEGLRYFDRKEMVGTGRFELPIS